MLPIINQPRVPNPNFTAVGGTEDTNGPAKRPLAGPDGTPVKRLRMGDPVVEESDSVESDEGDEGDYSELVASDPKFTSIFAVEGARHLGPAHVAEMDEGMVILPRDQGESIWTGGVASCRAFGFTSRTHIALSHSSIIDGPEETMNFEDHWSACKKAFQSVSHEAPILSQFIAIAPKALAGQLQFDEDTDRSRGELEGEGSVDRDVKDHINMAEQFALRQRCELLTMSHDSMLLDSKATVNVNIDSIDRPRSPPSGYV